MSNLADEISFFLQRVSPLAILDLLLVSAVFFFVISLLRGTRAVILLRGMVLLILIMALLTGLLAASGISIASEHHASCSAVRNPSCFCSRNSASL